MISSDDIRPMPEGWETEILKGKLDGREVLVWSHVGEGGFTARFGAYVSLNDPEAIEQATAELTRTAWNALEMNRLRLTDPDDLAWRSFMKTKLGITP